MARRLVRVISRGTKRSRFNEVEAAEPSLDRTVKTTVFLKNMNDFEAMGKVYSLYFPSHPPARATVEVARLHGGRVEIELIAVA